MKLNCCTDRTVGPERDARVGRAAHDRRLRHGTGQYVLAAAHQHLGAGAGGADVGAGLLLLRRRLHPPQDALHLGSAQQRHLRKGPSRLSYLVFFVCFFLFVFFYRVSSGSGQPS